MNRRPIASRHAPRDSVAQAQSRDLCGRDDRDALDFDAIDGRALFAAAAALGRHRGDPLKNVITFDQLAESRVLAIQEFSVAVAEEKLTAG
jgi:hypothetical protein